MMTRRNEQAEEDRRRSTRTRTRKSEEWSIDERRELSMYRIKSNEEEQETYEN